MHSHAQCTARNPTTAFSMLLFTACLFAPLATWAAEAPLERIAFGSCARQDQPQPIWEAVIATNPQCFLFIGDNIYDDSEDMEVLRTKYALLGAQPGYQKLKANCPVLAT